MISRIPAFSRFPGDPFHLLHPDPFRRWQFSTGAIVALVHDSLFTFSAFAIARVLGPPEIDQVFVAAVDDYWLFHQRYGDHL